MKRQAKRQPRPAKLVMVGTFPIDGHPLRVQLEWERENAYLRNLPKDDGPAVVGIGCDFGRNAWRAILDRVIHEGLEFMFLSRGWAHEPWGENGISSSNRTFVFSHEQYQVAVYFLAGFLDKVLPEVKREWLKMRKAHKQPTP